MFTSNSTVIAIARCGRLTIPSTRPLFVMGTAAQEVALYGRSKRYGEGMPQDYVQAHMWFNLAAANESEEGRENRDMLAEQMISAQIEEAQRLAREWLEQHGE